MKLIVKIGCIFEILCGITGLAVCILVACNGRNMRPFSAIIYLSFILIFSGVYLGYRWLEK